MTPTIFGRWQTRIATLATLGAIVTAIIAYANLGDAPTETFFMVLAYVAAIGLAWDLIYIALQRLRWDRDWPAAFQVANGVVEGIFLFVLIEYIGLPDIEEGSVPLWVFAVHYGSVWLATFVWVQGPMRAIFPRWRFYGGRLV